MLKAILFDLDNTLTDWHGSQRIYCRMLADRYLAASPKEDREAAAAEMVRLGGDGNDVSLEAWIEAIKERWPIPMTPEEILAERSALFPTYAVAFQGVEETLALLGERYKLGVVTNGGSEVQRRKIENANLARYFGCVVISGDIGASKPDPLPFMTCLRGLGVRPEEALFVGDSLDKDVMGALGVGMRAVRVRLAGYTYDSVEGVPEIDGVRDLPALLANRKEA